MLLFILCVSYKGPEKIGNFQKWSSEPVGLHVQWAARVPRCVSASPQNISRTLDILMWGFKSPLLLKIIFIGTNNYIIRKKLGLERWLNSLEHRMLFQRTRVWHWVLSPNDCSQLAVTPVPRVQKPSSGPLRHQQYILCADLHIGKTPIHIKIINKNKIKFERKKLGVLKEYVNWNKLDINL